MNPPATAGWMVPLRPREEPRVRLVCVPYAGAGVAAFRGWPDLLPAWLEPWGVRLPARETRLHERPTARVEVIAGAVADALWQETLPYCLYGHSMGALVCFEVARELRRRGAPRPAHLFVSGRRAPQMPDDLPGICHLPSTEFIAAVRALNGIPEVLFREPGLIDLIEPALRADFAVCENYRFRPEEPLPCGISVFGGDADPTTDGTQLTAWRRQTSGSFSVRRYAGDHFFIHTHRAALLAAIASDVGTVCSGRTV